MIEHWSILKQVVLVLFFLFFSGVWLWTYAAPRREAVEAKRFIPFQERGESSDV